MPSAPVPHQPFWRILYVQVLFAIALGILLGWQWPHVATNDWIKALGDGFIKLIKMMIAPIIFCTVVSGIAGVTNVQKVGRVGGKALVYFEAVSTLALIIGLTVANVLKPGAGLLFQLSNSPLGGLIDCGCAFADRNPRQSYWPVPSVGRPG